MQVGRLRSGCADGDQPQLRIQEVMAFARLKNAAPGNRVTLPKADKNAAQLRNVQTPPRWLASEKEGEIWLKRLSMTFSKAKENPFGKGDALAVTKAQVFNHVVDKQHANRVKPAE